MATYQHGVYNQEQATSLTTPIRSSAALQVIFGTAPVHLADDPTKAANTPKLCYSCFTDLSLQRPATICWPKWWPAIS